ncbi:hypothetical protein CEXT_560431 [Caerostris extrusa]|uniref:Uncharacterized protein n=1 Tax=Caerostris extrusa TaxID=172846 RepID=A0AAV4MIR3_CAEEX|nr:hypothetical protein CEXT_560431 [Caerostris extrusa]
MGSFPPLTCQRPCRVALFLLPPNWMEVWDRAKHASHIPKKFPPLTILPTKNQNPTRHYICGPFRAIRYLSGASSISRAEQWACGSRYPFFHHLDSLMAHTEALFPSLSVISCGGKLGSFPHLHVGLLVESRSLLLSPNWMEVPDRGKHVSQ